MSLEPRRSRGPLPRLHVVTDDSVLGRRSWAESARAVLEAGGDGVCLHVRGRYTEGRTFLRLVSELLPHAARTGGHLFVNDRVDVGLVKGLEGVHLGSRSLPVGVVRGLLGPEPWLGRSTHAVAAADAARAEGADYVFLGTIFETPTHPNVELAGLDGVRKAARVLGDLPVIGIGGIDPGRAGRVRGAGAHGVAVVRGVWNARDPATAVRRYLSAMANGGQVEGD